MQDVLLVGVMYGSRQRLDQLKGLTEAEGFAVERLGQRRSVHMLDGVVEQLTIALAGFEDLHDVGVGETAERTGLAAQTAPGELAGIVLGEHHLEHHGAIDEQLPRPVQVNAGGAFAEVLQDLEAGDDGPSVLVAQGRRRQRLGRRRRQERRRLLQQRHRLGGVPAHRTAVARSVRVVLDLLLPVMALRACQQFEHDPSRRSMANSLRIIAQAGEGSRVRELGVPG